MDITRSRLSIAFLTGSAKLQGLAMFSPSVLHPNMVEGTGTICLKFFLKAVDIHVIHIIEERSLDGGTDNFIK